MKILVLGGSGMLGHQLCRVLSKRQEVWATFHDRSDAYERYQLLPGNRMIGGVDVGEWPLFSETLKEAKPDVVVNAIGIVKQRDEAKQAVMSIEVNALFPHRLADLCHDIGARLIQISTDCVFSGFRGGYSELDLPDPVDLYGRTKLLGEINRDSCLTLRTSIIGWELRQRAGLLEWFASQRGKTIKGYGKAIYSGVSTAVLAHLIGDIIETRPELAGLYHVASNPISKYDLLVRLKERLGWEETRIEKDEAFHCDRSLVGKRFEMITGWKVPDWEKMIDGLVLEWPIYEKWRRAEK
jgi:dTDP-4-dehydrorhamnose reductase